MEKEHQYQLTINWTGNKGEGTKSYKGYSRSHTISVSGKTIIQASSDPSFLGDKTCYNPEELFLASLSSCHMLWYLHLCSEAGLIVTDYEDKAQGIMTETADGCGRFTSVLLRPVVTVIHPEMIEKANELHQLANQRCFIANSCNFPVLHQPICIVATT